MERLRDGDESALAMLDRRHRSLFRGLIAAIVGDSGDVEEVLQEALVQIWRDARIYRPAQGRALAWIATLVRHRAIDRMRRKVAYDQARDRFREETRWGRHSNDADVEFVDNANILARLLKRLPKPQSNAVQMAYYCGMSQREISVQTGIPMGTIKMRLKLALRKLRSAVAALRNGELNPAV